MNVRITKLNLCVFDKTSEIQKISSRENINLYSKFQHGGLCKWYSKLCIMSQMQNQNQPKIWKYNFEKSVIDHRMDRIVKVHSYSFCSFDLKFYSRSSWNSVNQCAFICKGCFTDENGMKMTSYVMLSRPNVQFRHQTTGTKN